MVVLWEEMEKKEAILSGTDEDSYEVAFKRRPMGCRVNCSNNGRSILDRRKDMCRGLVWRKTLQVRGPERRAV